MPVFILDQKTTATPPFDFLGDCYICATGSGQIKIQRKVGSEFHNLTNENGDEMVHTPRAGSNVIFNGRVTANKKMEHRIIADTTGQIMIEILKERG